MTPEQFLARPNVKMIMQSDDLPFTPKDLDRWSKSSGAQDAAPPILSRAARGLVELADRGEQVIKQWCTEHQKALPPLLNDALIILFAAMLSAGTPKNRDSGEVAEDAAQRVIEVLKDPKNGHPPETRQAILQMLEIVSAMGMTEFMDRMQPGDDVRQAGDRHSLR